MIDSVFPRCKDKLLSTSQSPTFCNSCKSVFSISCTFFPETKRQESSAYKRSLQLTAWLSISGLLLQRRRTKALCLLPFSGAIQVALCVGQCYFIRLYEYSINLGFSDNTHAHRISLACCRLRVAVIQPWALGHRDITTDSHICSHSTGTCYAYTPVVDREVVCGHYTNHPPYILVINKFF